MTGKLQLKHGKNTTKTGSPAASLRWAPQGCAQITAVPVKSVVMMDVTSLTLDRAGARSTLTAGHAASRAASKRLALALPYAFPMVEAGAVPMKDVRGRPLASGVCVWPTVEASAAAMMDVPNLQWVCLCKAKDSA